MSNIEETSTILAMGGKKKDEQTVHFRHLGEHESANFRVNEQSSLQAIWEQSYHELKIDRDPRDILQAPHAQNPQSLMEHLSLSLADAQEKGLCNNKFEIAARTGGA